MTVHTQQVKPFKQNIMLNHSQKKFDKALLSAKVTIQRAFGVLKGHWRCLLKRLDNNLENIPHILACCVLHNITQLKGDSYIDYDDIFPQVFQDQRRARDMGHIHNEVCLENERLREILTRYISRDAWRNRNFPFT